MDLFEHRAKQRMEQEQPLAARMRPRTLDEYVGQDHILAEGRLLRRAIQADQLSSLLFYGPPGTGKTTLASVIANTTRSHFQVLNAVLAGVKDIRQVIKEAQRRWIDEERRTILFVDEVHRWNKSQQDALLPWVENGTVILIGATTENPYFSVNRALLSRSRVFQLKPLTDDNLRQVVEQVLKDERAYKHLKVVVDEDAREHLIKVANGDARAILNALELAVETTPEVDGCRHLDMKVAEESIQQKAVLYDREGDYHFDIISAFIKSIRGSDPDAALYWMAKMIHAGEDPRYILRRMLISASEDIGMADPNALIFVQTAATTFDRVGMPEGNFHLAQAALYLATAPKSNSTLAFFDALRVVREERDHEVPNHLRDASRDKEGFGHGAGYQYPHAYRDHWVAQQYLPSSLQGRVFYNPGRLGFEREIADDVARRREEQVAAMNDGQLPVAPPEILTFSPTDKSFDRWLERTLSGSSERLQQFRNELFASLSVQRHDRILVLGDDSGLLTWEALRRVPEGGVWVIVSTPEKAARLHEQCRAFHEDHSVSLRMPSILVGDCYNAATVIEDKLQFEWIVGRNVLTMAEDMDEFLTQVDSLLVFEGTWSFGEVMPFYTTKLNTLLQLPEELNSLMSAAEMALYEEAYGKAAFLTIEAIVEKLQSELMAFAYSAVDTEFELNVNEKVLRRWFDWNRTESLGNHLVQAAGEEKAGEISRFIWSELANKTLKMNSKILFMHNKKNVEA